MARSVTVNAHLAAELAALPEESAAPMRAAVENALAMGPGELDAADQYPLLGYHLRISEGELLLYVVTPGRFVRYQIFEGQSLTVTVPITRVSRVVERVGESELLVSVELDADALTAQFETQGRANGSESAGAGLARLVRTVYEIAPHGESAEDRALDRARVAAFSRAVRSAVGL